MMKRTGTVAMALVLVCCFLLAACAAPAATPAPAPAAPAAQAAPDAPAEEPAKVWNIALCTIYPFDQAVWLTEMIEDMRKFDDENDNVNIKIVEVSETSQYEPKIRALAEQGIYDMIMTQFSGHVEATLAVAKDYPNIVFFNQDGMVPNIEQYPNVTEGRGGDRLSTGFLTGALAALMTKTGKVVFMGGKDIENVQMIAAGWQQGIKYVNPDVEEKFVIPDTFNDTTITREMATSLYQQGYDIIGVSASGANAGVVQAAAEFKGDLYAWVLPFESHFHEIADGHELASGVAHNGVMGVNAIKALMDGTLQMSIVKIYGFPDGVNEVPFCAGDAVPQDVQDRFAEILADVLDGKITITRDFHY